MKYLRSVDSYWDEEAQLVYVCKSKDCRDTEEGHSIKEMSEEWWSRIDCYDMARIDVNGGLF